MKMTLNYPLHRVFRARRFDVPGNRIFHREANIHLGIYRGIVYAYLWCIYCILSTLNHAFTNTNIYHDSDLDYHKLRCLLFLSHTHTHTTSLLFFISHSQTFIPNKNVPVNPMHFLTPIVSRLRNERES